MQTSVQWLENVAFEAKSESGHSVVMDGSAEYGGENRGPRPMELILMGLGGCASFDIVTILKKSRQEVTHVECQLKQNVPIASLQCSPKFICILWSKARLSRKSRSRRRLNFQQKNTVLPVKCYLMVVLKLAMILKLLNKIKR